MMTNRFVYQKFREPEFNETFHHFFYEFYQHLENEFERLAEYILSNRQLDTTFENGKFKIHFFVWEYRIGDIGYYDEETDESYNDFDIECHNADRKQALAGLVCELWDELTPEQREEVRGILK